MPLVGLIPFLQKILFDVGFCAGCVNALGRAYPISTNNDTQNTTTSAQCVNALGRAYPISTSTTTPAKYTRNTGVNALGQAYPISTSSWWKDLC